jgi:hypothetical protein
MRWASWSDVLFQPSRGILRFPTTPVVPLEYLRRQCCYTVPLPWSKVLPHELKSRSPTLASESGKILVRDSIAIFWRHACHECKMNRCIVD